MSFAHLAGAGILGLLLLATLGVMLSSPAQPAPAALPTAAGRLPTAPLQLLDALTATAASRGAPLKLGDGLAALDSYRATLVLTASGTLQDRPGAFDARLVIIQEQNSPLAQRLVYTYTDSLSQAYQYREQVRLADSSFLVTSQPDGRVDCIAQRVRQLEPLGIETLFYLDLGYLADARYTGEESLDLPGPVRTRRYSIERSVLGDLSGQAEAWVAAEGGYVVKLQAEAAGHGTFQALPGFEGRLAARYTVSHINQAVPIEPPGACLGGAPLMAGAEGVAVMSNLVTYKVQAPAPAVVEFYGREMVARGWHMDGEPYTEDGVSLLTFTRGGQTTTVLLSPTNQDSLTEIAIVLPPAR